MLRRPPTVITLTTDDLTAYEASRARRQHEASIAKQHQQQKQKQQHQSTRQQQPRNTNTAASNGSTGDRGASSSRPDQNPARRTSQPPSSHVQPQAHAVPREAPPRVPSAPSVFTRQQPSRQQDMTHQQGLQATAAVAAAAQRRQLQRQRRAYVAPPTGSGSPHERADSMPQLNDVDGMDVSDASPSVESDDDETGELDDSMAAAGARQGSAGGGGGGGSSQYHLPAPQTRLAQMRRLREGRARVQHGSLVDDDEENDMGRSIGASFETPTNAPREGGTRAEGEQRQRAAATAATGRWAQQQQRAEAMASGRQQPALTRHERIMGRVEAPAPQGMGERSMR